MTLANPLALLWGLAAIPVVLLYWRRMRLRRVEVATAMFWDQVFAEDQARQAWHRWRHGVSLVVQLLALLLLVLALAEPLIPGPRSVVIVIDNSASMNGAETKPTRLDQAKEAATQLVEGLRPCDRAAVLSAGDAVGVRCGLDNHRETFLAAIKDVPATQGASRVQDAVRIARSLLDDGVQGRILVLSDARFPAAAKLAEADDVELVRVGKSAGNVAVTRLEVRRSPDDPLKAQVFAETTNFSDQPAEARLEVLHNDRPLGAESIRMDADGRWQQVFELTTADAGRLTARVEPNDALAADDQLTVDIPSAARHRVVLLGSENRFVESSLRANPRVELAEAATPPTGGETGALRVFVGEVPASLPEGPAIVVGPESACGLFQPGEPLSDTVVAGQDFDSAILSDISLVGMGLPGALALELSDAADPLAIPIVWNADHVPLILAIDRPAGRVVLFAGGLDSGQLPLSSAMPVLLANALDWVADSTDSDVTKATDERNRPAESDLRVPKDLGVGVAEFSFPSPGVPPWVVLVLAAVVLLTVEWCLYHRRWLT